VNGKKTRGVFYATRFTERSALIEFLFRAANRLSLTVALPDFLIFLSTWLLGKILTGLMSNPKRVREFSRNCGALRRAS
jgi:hypothetical protein